MKFALLSDLHLEFASYKEQLPDADILLLAGDISNQDPASIANQLHFHERCVQKYGKNNIVQIGGNHEMYYGRWESSELIVRVHEDVAIIACTLWSGRGSEIAYQHMNDSRVIDGWDWNTMVKDHRRCVDFIVEQLKIHKDKKTVVMTHHMPSAACIDPKYAGSFMNPGFYTDLDWILEDHSPDVWVHGHTHSSIDKIVKNTRIICNPRGYVTYRGVENSEFNPGKTFEV